MLKFIHFNFIHFFKGNTIFLIKLNKALFEQNETCVPSLKMFKSLRTPVNIKKIDNYFHWRTQSTQLFLIQLQKKVCFSWF